MRIHVTLRGALAGDGPPQQRKDVQLPWGSTVEYLIGHLSIQSTEVQLALVNGRPVARSVSLSDGDKVVLGGAH